MDGSASYELVQGDQLTMTAGTYSYPERRTPFDERNPEGEKSVAREALRRQIEQEEAIRAGQRAEQRRDNTAGSHEQKGER